MQVIHGGQCYFNGAKVSESVWSKCKSQPNFELGGSHFASLEKGLRDNKSNRVANWIAYDLDHWCALSVGEEVYVQCVVVNGETVVPWQWEPLMLKESLALRPSHRIVFQALAKGVVPEGLSPSPEGRALALKGRPRDPRLCSAPRGPAVATWGPHVAAGEIGQVVLLLS